jgi:hypothetical protein
VTAESHLSRVVLYKVGHHGSHNATLRAQGLEMMPDRNFRALVPVDTYVAHEKKRWMKMPFKPLMNRLGEKTKDGGLVVRADQPIGPGKTLGRDGFAVRIEDAEERFDRESKGVDDDKTKERPPCEDLPLYVDCTIELGQYRVAGNE